MSKDLVPSGGGNAFLPEIVDEDGVKIVGPELESVSKLVTEMAQLAQLARIRKALERTQYEGKNLVLELEATEDLQYIDLLEEPPHRALATAYLINRGPDTVMVSMNTQDEGWEVEYKEDEEVDFSNADRRIERIYYWCAHGESGTIKLLGKY